MFELPQSPLDPRLAWARPAPAWPWWLALVAICSLIFGMHFLEKRSTGPLPDPATVDSAVLRLYSRYMMGATSLVSGMGQSAGTMQADALAALDDAAPTLIDRIRVVPVAAELGGVDAARARLDALDAELAADPSLDDGFRRDARTLRSVLAPAADGPPPAPDAASLAEFERRHGWFARLATAQGKPAGDPARAAIDADARRAMVAVLVIVLVVAAAAVSGLVLFIVAAAMLGGRRVTIAMPSMRPAVWAGALPSARASLLEAFVLFLGLFVVASLLAEVGRLATGIDLTFVFAWLLTPIALWPLSRGLTWPGLRAAMGWTGGRGVLREMGAGVVGHLAGLPIVGLGLAVSFVIVAITGADASHPIVNDATGSPWRLAGLFLMTTVWAPLVEESMFRGALYAHLRSVPRRAADPATGAMTARGMPALASGLVTGLVFAAIHPQGFAGVPVLAALGLNFCLIREWRGSIIAPMTAHAVHNGLITAVLVVLMG